MFSCDLSPSPHSAPHLLFAGVVTKQPGSVVQDKPPVLPALHNIRPLGQSSLHVLSYDYLKLYKQFSRAI